MHVGFHVDRATYWRMHVGTPYWIEPYCPSSMMIDACRTPSLTNACRPPYWLKPYWLDHTERALCWLSPMATATCRATYWLSPHCLGLLIELHIDYCMQNPILTKSILTKLHIVRYPYDRTPYKLSLMLTKLSSRTSYDVHPIYPIRMTAFLKTERRNLPEGSYGENLQRRSKQFNKISWMISDYV